MKRLVISTILASVAGLALVATLDAAGTTGPKARYNMDVGTMTGFAGMGKGMGGAMSMMFGGGGNKVAHELQLRLGSGLTPDKGAAKADHIPNAGLKLGKALPLVSPQREPRDDGLPENFEKPKGRLLIFWGCGAKAAKGQPVIIDFSKVAQGQVPSGLMSVRVPVDRGPRPSNSKTYGEWPNSKGGKGPGSDASVLGEHRVVGNYTPEMKFTLNQDFMGPINGRATNIGGATTLSWNAVPSATGYHAWVMGMKMDQSRNSMGDMVWWSSSSAKEFGGGLWDWLSPGTVQSLIAQKIVMPPSQTSCTVPAEVKAAAPDMMMGNLYAYGPEANFAYPPKPAAGIWNIEWTARVRYRSTTSWMIGGAMGGMGAAGADGQEKPRCKPSVFGAVLGKGC